MQTKQYRWTNNQVKKQNSIIGLIVSGFWYVERQIVSRFLALSPPPLLRSCGSEEKEPKLLAD